MVDDSDTGRRNIHCPQFVVVLHLLPLGHSSQKLYPVVRDMVIVCVGRSVNVNG